MNALIDFIKRTVGIKKAAIGLGYAVFMLVFWILGKPHQMGPFTALFGVLAVTLVYYLVVKLILKIFKV